MLSQGQRDPTWASPAVEIRRNKLLDEIGFSEPVILVRVLRTDTTHDLSQFGNRNVLDHREKFDRCVALAAPRFPALFDRDQLSKSFDCHAMAVALQLFSSLSSQLPLPVRLDHV